MGEVREETKDTPSPIDIFVCYAREDEEYRQRLEKHLSIFQRERLIHVWHDGNISPGEEWEQVIHLQLNTAQIVLLLVSPDFMASEYCYGIEMREALERHAQGKARVIPIIVRPILWKRGPLGTLQALPKNAKPIALWRHRDEAFFDVAEGIRCVIEEIKTQLLLSPLSSQQRENGEENLQKTSVLQQKPLPEEPLVQNKAHQASTDLSSSEGLSQALMYGSLIAVEDSIPPFDESIYIPQSKKPRKRRLLISAAILLALVVSLVWFLPLPTCSFAFCHASPQPTKQSSPQHEGEIQDQNLSVELVAIVSPSFVLPDEPKRYSDGNTPPMSISAVSLTKNTSTYDTIIINVQNLRYEGADILIDSIALKLLSIPPLPRPLRIWTPGAPTTYIGYPYPVTYRGQTLGQLLYAEPSKNVILTPADPNHTGESEKLSIQVMSTVTAFLRFQVEITYQITGGPQTLTLPQIFQVVFSDSSNWQEEIL